MLADSRSLRHTQNFLRSRSLVACLVERAELAGSDVVYEIGPGRGIITEALAARCRRVVAVEKDPLLARRLRRRFAAARHVEIREGDFLDQPLPRRPFKVFASLPFDATAAIVRKLTGARTPPLDAHLVVQREAAERFTGRPRETLAALLLEPWFELSVVHRFRRCDFDPEPGVDVVMLRMRKRGPPLVRRADAPLYRDFVAALFTERRPTMLASLAALAGRRRAHELARRAGLDEEATPSEVPFERWLALFQAARDARQGQALIASRGAHGRLQRLQATLVKVHRTRAPRRRAAAL